MKQRQERHASGNIE